MSGGPMLNEEGRVIGIHGKGDKQEGIDTGRKLGIPTKIFLALNLENTRPQNIPWLNGLLFSLIHIIAIDILFISSITIFFLVTDKNSIDINLDFAFRVITVLLNPGFFIAIFFYGVIFLGGELGAVFYYTQGEYQNAINRYDKLIWINANWDFNYNNRGLAYSDLGDKQNAISDYNQAIQLNPNYADAYYNRGNAYSYLGDKQNAISDYTQAIQLDPKNANAYTGRGYAYSDLGDKQNAIADFQKAAELYKQQGNQVWYQNALNQIKKLQSSDTP
jgi:predicted negative regulator of RcsB-dependent stress response